MDEMTFRKMLAEIAREMRDRDLESMKFLCNEIIPKGQREDIETPIQLWESLEERDKLSRQDTTFLRHLLENGTGKRTDLINILNKYESPPMALEPQRTHPQRTPLHLTDDLQKAIEITSSEIGKHWKPLARELRLSDADIDYCIEKHPRDLREQVREALCMWARNRGSEATKENLCQALKNSQQVFLSQKLESL